MFPCRFCNGPTRVINTEHHPDGQRRWRRCNLCNELTRTTESTLDPRRTPGKARAQGSRNAAAVLTEDDVRRLRIQAARGVPHTELSRIYGVIPATVSRIVNRHAWAHVA